MSFKVKTSTVYGNFHLDTDASYWDFELCGDTGAHEDIIRFDYDDVPGLAHAVAKQDIAAARELIDAYLKKELGYTPDYTIND